MKAYTRQMVCSLILLVYTVDAVDEIDHQKLDLLKSEDTTILNELDDNVTTSVSPPIRNNYDYIVHMEYALIANTIPRYITNMIYSNYKELNITSEDVIRLSGLESSSLESALSLMFKLNKSENDFNLSNLKVMLDIINMTSSEFYIKLKDGLQLSPTVLVEVLDILKIDGLEFSYAIAFGKYDVIDVVMKGDLTDEAIQIAMNKSNTNVYDLYDIILAITLNQIKVKNLNFLGMKLQSYGYNREDYNKFWEALNLTLYDVYNVEKCRKIVDDIKSALSKNLNLGVLTDKNEIVIHRKIYDSFKAYLDIITIYAHSSTGSVIRYLKATSLVIQPTYVTVELYQTDNNVTSFIRPPSKFTKNLRNCSYCLIENEEFSVVDVPVLANEKQFIYVKNDNKTVFNLGNPLICNKAFYGLASKENLENITFDTLYSKEDDSIIPEHTYSGCSLIHTEKFWINIGVPMLLYLIVFN